MSERPARLEGQVQVLLWGAAIALAAILGAIGWANTQTNGRIDRVDTRMGHIESRLDRVDTDLNRIGGRLDRIESILVHPRH